MIPNLETNVISLTGDKNRDWSPANVEKGKSLISERMKPGINENLHEIKIGGIAGNTSTDT